MPASAKQHSLMMATGLDRSWPRNRRGAMVPGFPWRFILPGAGRPQDQLGHPDEKAVTADHADGDHRPDESDDDGEYEKFRTPAVCGNNPIQRRRIVVSPDVSLI